MHEGTGTVSEVGGTVYVEVWTVPGMGRLCLGRRGGGLCLR